MRRDETVLSITVADAMKLEIEEGTSGAALMLVNLGMAGIELFPATPDLPLSDGARLSIRNGLYPAFIYVPDQIEDMLTEWDLDGGTDRPEARDGLARMRPFFVRLLAESRFAMGEVKNKPVPFELWSGRKA